MLSIACFCFILQVIQYERDVSSKNNNNKKKQCKVLKKKLFTEIPVLGWLQQGYKCSLDE